MEFWKKQKGIMIAFGIFLAFMFLCTLISRVVYASRLPQVSVEKPQRMPVSHKVEVDGIVHQGREYAVNVLSGLRVKTVYAHVGDKVDEGTLLFEVDMEDLAEKIREQEIAIKKLQLQISAQEKNRSLEEGIHQAGSIRAQEDYNRAAVEAQEGLKNAEEELKKAQDELEKKKDSPAAVTSEHDRKAAQDNYNAWVKEGERLKHNVEQTKADYEALKGASDGSVSGNDVLAEAEAAYRAAQSAYLKYMESPVAKPDFSAEDNARSVWEAEKKSLEDKANAAAEAVEDKKRSNQQSVQEAGRKVEDENRDEPVDYSLEINRLELSSMQEKLKSYQEIAGTGGKVYPKAEGIVTRIQVSAGERVPDGAAFVCADLSSPMQFQVTLTKEQKQYVNQGDMADLSLGNARGNECTIDYIAESEAAPGTYEASIFLPEGMGTLGQSGKLEVKAQSETFNCCIPINALREDGNHRKFVYIVSRKDGILGEELAAEMVYVKVLDQNDAYAAIEEGVIDEETELIISSTEPLEDRDVIRYRE